MLKRTTAEHTADAKTLRDRPEECHALAQVMITKENTLRYLSLADAYTALAEQEEQLARDVETFELKGPPSPVT
jgi:hypothetical protein